LLKYILVRVGECKLKPTLLNQTVHVNELIQMQKIILGLIIVFGLLGCKDPIKEAIRKDEIRDDKKSIDQSAHYKSENIGIQIQISHGKSVAHGSSEIKAEHFTFSIVLRGKKPDESFLTAGRIEASKSVGDSLQFYTNNISRALIPKECEDILGIFPPSVCEYQYSIDPKNITQEPLQVKVSLTRGNGEVLSAVFDTPALIQLLEPRFPFNPISLNNTTLLSWQSALPIRLQSGSWSSQAGCSAYWLYETIQTGAQDTYYILSKDSFRLEQGCDPILTADLTATKEWRQLEGSAFKNVNIEWYDYLRVSLFGDFKGTY
jgi:hypothetical protein